MVGYHFLGSGEACTFSSACGKTGHPAPPFFLGGGGGRGLEMEGRSLGPNPTLLQTPPLAAQKTSYQLFPPFPHFSLDRDPFLLLLFFSFSLRQFGNLLSFPSFLCSVFKNISLKKVGLVLRNSAILTKGKNLKFMGYIPFSSNLLLFTILCQLFSSFDYTLPFPSNFDGNNI